MQGSCGHHGKRLAGRVTGRRSPGCLAAAGAARPPSRAPAPALPPPGRLVSGLVCLPSFSYTFNDLLCICKGKTETHNLINSALSFIVCIVGPSWVPGPQLPGSFLSSSRPPATAARLRADRTHQGKPSRCGLSRSRRDCWLQPGSRPALSSSLAAGGRVGRGVSGAGQTQQEGCLLAGGHAHEWSVCCRRCKKAKNGEMKLYI